MLGSLGPNDVFVVPRGNGIGASSPIAYMPVSPTASGSPSSMHGPVPRAEIEISVPRATTLYRPPGT